MAVLSAARLAGVISRLRSTRVPSMSSTSALKGPGEAVRPTGGSAIEDLRVEEVGRPLAAERRDQVLSGKPGHPGAGADAGAAKVRQGGNGFAGQQARVHAARTAAAA